MNKLQSSWPTENFPCDPVRHCSQQIAILIISLLLLLLLLLSSCILCIASRPDNRGIHERGITSATGRRLTGEEQEAGAVAAGHNGPWRYDCIGCGGGGGDNNAQRETASLRAWLLSCAADGLLARRTAENQRAHARTHLPPPSTNGFSRVRKTTWLWWGEVFFLLLSPAVVLERQSSPPRGVVVRELSAGLAVRIKNQAGKGTEN